MHKTLLIIDGIVNLIIGILLLLFPLGMDKLLGLPLPSDYFYTTILGAVLTGIGVALLIELKSDSTSVRGLGLEGAIVINALGAGGLLFLLLIKEWALPLRGSIILWTIVSVVFIIAILEIFNRSTTKSPKLK